MRDIWDFFWDHENWPVTVALLIGFAAGVLVGSLLCGF